jgi:hypothetical protein
MKTKLPALAVIALGILLVIIGARREDSVEGVADSVGTSVANVWDGKARQPGYVWYYIGGGMLVAAGLYGLIRKSGS